MNDDFQDIVELLLEHGADFVVVGAHALAVHGAARATGDLDIWVRPTLDNAEKVVQALLAFGAPLAAHGVSAADLAAPGAVYQLGLPPRRIDILTEIDGVTFEQAWRGRVSVELGTVKVPFLGRAELVANKRASGRPKDLADLAMLDEA